MTDSPQTGAAGEPGVLPSSLDGHDPLALDPGIASGSSPDVVTGGNGILDTIAAVGSHAVSLPTIAFACVATLAALIGRGVLMSSLSAVYADCLLPSGPLVSARSVLTALRSSGTEARADAVSSSGTHAAVLGQQSSLARGRPGWGGGGDAAPPISNGRAGGSWIRPVLLGVSLLALSLALLPAWLFRRVVLAALPGRAYEWDARLRARSGRHRAAARARDREHAPVGDAETSDRPRNEEADCGSYPVCARRLRPDLVGVGIDLRGGRCALVFSSNKQPGNRGGAVVHGRWCVSTHDHLAPRSVWKAGCSDEGARRVTPGERRPDPFPCGSEANARWRLLGSPVLAPASNRRTRAAVLAVARRAGPGHGAGGLLSRRQRGGSRPGPLPRSRGCERESLHRLLRLLAKPGRMGLCRTQTDISDRRLRSRHPS